MFFRTEHVIENQKSPVRKVPIKIVHSEGAGEKESSPFLQRADPPAVRASGVTRLGGLGASGQDSVFCAFTRQREPDGQRDTYMSTGRDQAGSDCQESLMEEEQKREELARDIMGKDKSLADILDQSKMKTTMDLMEGIFPEGEQLLEEAHQRRKPPQKQSTARPPDER